MYALPNSKYENSLSDASNFNVSQNIIAGPGPRDYWNHNPGAQKALVQEQGPWPQQGNIGSLISNEAANYENCVNDRPSIGGSPNCAGSFVADIYTTSDTCGDSCKVKYPESFGMKDFGFKENADWHDKVTNAHQVHTYSTLRAAMPGQFSSTGNSEWIPELKTNETTGTTYLDQPDVYRQVGALDRLPNFSKFRYTTFNSK